MSDSTKDIHITVVVAEDGSVRVDRLPFRAGQAVDATIHAYRLRSAVTRTANTRGQHK